MVRTLREKRKAEAAYTLVDLSELDEELRKDILEDANEGGGTYGIRVVEESVNGGARAPIYGVYKEGPDAERWTNAKKELGISGSEVDDSEVYAGAGVEITDPRREAALREAAALKVEDEARRIRAGEDAEINAITHDEDGDDTAPVAGHTPDLDHPINIVDPGAVGAENEAAKAGPAEADKASARAPRNKAPK